MSAEFVQVVSKKIVVKYQDLSLPSGGVYVRGKGRERKRAKRLVQSSSNW